MVRNRNKKVYAVAKGRSPGIYFSWKDCEKQVRGFSGQDYQGVFSEIEARAWMEKKGFCEENGAWVTREENPTPSLAKHDVNDNKVQDHLAEVTSEPGQKHKRKSSGDPSSTNQTQNWIGSMEEVIDLMEPLYGTLILPSDEGELTINFDHIKSRIEDLYHDMRRTSQNHESDNPVKKKAKPDDAVGSNDSANKKSDAV